jgi:K+-transporting ATPase ATPase B chain
MMDRKILEHAAVDAVRKLDPRWMVRNPVMFVVEVGCVLSTALWVQALVGVGDLVPGSIGPVLIWMWFTVLFANFSEALRRSRKDTMAKRFKDRQINTSIELIASQTLRKGELILVEVGDVIPADGEVIEGIASVDESAITGESAPVIREAGGDRSAVTGGTLVLSDWLIIRISANPGEGFLDHMISLIEGARRQKDGSFKARCELVRDLTALSWKRSLNEITSIMLQATRSAVCAEWATVLDLSIDKARLEVEALLLEGRKTYEQKG